MKKGISIMVLIITILIISVLAGIVVFTGVTPTNKAKLANFTTNMSKLENAATTYYSTRGRLPVKENTQVFQKNDLESLLERAEYADDLFDEISSNGDDSSKFYYLDIEKIGIEKELGGLSFDGDYFLINGEGTHVYYLKGYKVGDEIYFSIGKDLT